MARSYTDRRDCVRNRDFDSLSEGSGESGVCQWTTAPFFKRVPRGTISRNELELLAAGSINGDNATRESVSTAALPTHSESSIITGQQLAQNCSTSRSARSRS